MARKKSVSPKQLVAQATGIRLSAHELLCAERMQTIQNSINELKREVKSLRTDVSTGKGMVKVLVFLGTIVATIIGVLSIK